MFCCITEVWIKLNFFWLYCAFVFVTETMSSKINVVRKSLFQENGQKLSSDDSVHSKRSEIHSSPSIKLNNSIVACALIIAIILGVASEYRKKNHFSEEDNKSCCFLVFLTRKKDVRHTNVYSKQTIHFYEYFITMHVILSSYQKYTFFSTSNSETWKVNVKTKTNRDVSPYDHICVG